MAIKKGDRFFGEYSYVSASSGRDPGYYFAQMVEHSAKGREFFFDSLDIFSLKPVQNKDMEGEIHNVELQGIGFSRKKFDPSLSIYKFIIKPSNAHAQISAAISRAKIIRGKAHFVYIIIPDFDQNSFYDFDKLSEYLDSCRESRIGVISVQMIREGDLIGDILEVLPAEMTDEMDLFEYNKIIGDGEDREEGEPL